MSGNRIMVGNLPYEADERAISDALGHLGHITDCKVRICLLYTSDAADE